MYKHNLRHTKLFAALLAISLLAGCSPLERKLRELDRTIAQKEVFRENLETRLDSLRSVHAGDSCDSLRWIHANELYKLYKFYQVDSALSYLKEMDRYDSPQTHAKTVIESVDIYTSLRNYASATEAIASLDTLSLNESELAQYYNSLLFLYAIEAEDESLPQSTRNEMLEKRYTVRKKYLACEGIDPFEKVRRHGIQLYEDGKAKEAIPILKGLVKDSENLGEKAAAAYSLANAYIETKQNDEAKYWYAQSAIYSLQRPVRAFQSLYELSKILYIENTLQRASDYSRSALEDALEANYNAQVYTTATSKLAIVSAVDYQNKRIRVTGVMIIVIFAVLLFVIAWLLLRNMKKSRDLRRAHRKLEEANKIKEGYVFQYIGLSANYLQKIEDFRRDLRQDMKNGNIDGIKKMLRDPNFNVDEYKHFYSIFDETFLGLFPNFVDKVNSLLPEDEQFKLKNPNELPTGLRILAAIKLGITDSGKIAEFLTCAPSSVYTHRSKIKKKALCSAEEFEKLVSDF